MKGYLKFSVIEEKPITVVVEVTSKQYGYRLGEIRWLGKWRQYTFFPEVATAFSKGCLQEIIKYIEGLR